MFFKEISSPRRQKGMAIPEDRFAEKNFRDTAFVSR